MFFIKLVFDLYLVNYPKITFVIIITLSKFIVQCTKIQINFDYSTNLYIL